MEIKINGGEIVVNVQGVVFKSLNQSTQLIRGKAIKNAPILSGNLRRSITVAMGIKKDSASVGTNLKYGRIREFVNKKHPRTKFYMRRAYNSSINRVKEIFTKNIENELHKYM